MRHHQLLTLLLAGCLVLPALTPVSCGADFDTELLRMTSPTYEKAAAQLRNAPQQQYDFSKAILADVLRFLATDAGISFFSLPDDSPEGQRMISFSIKSSPFQVLETLAKANGLALIPENGIWYIRPADDKELIGKSYEIRNNAFERVTQVQNAVTGSLGVPGSAIGAGGGSGSGGVGVSSGGGGIDLQGGDSSFAVQRSEMINDIRAILDLPPETQDGASSLQQAMLDPKSMVDATNSNELSAARRPKVIWKSDSNTLYVVATRLQHMWVEGYLEAADKKQAMIAIEVKFIETSLDPNREFGMDWTGTFGENGTFRQVDKAEIGKDAFDNPTVKIDYTSQQTKGGYRSDLAPLLSALDLNDVAGTLGWPSLSVISAQDINVKLRALLRDQETKTVSYPRMVTLNNREVAIRSVVNQPVLSATSSASLGTGATTTAQIEYLPIGTVLNILPKRMQEDRVLLNMAITVSTIVGQEVIQGNNYPIASSRVYSAPVEVNSGYTVAVGGLDEARESKGETGIPVLGKIPVLGYAFKYKNRSKNHKNLMIFITPSLIDARDGGLPEEPQSIVPQRPANELPQIPKIDANTGALIGGPAAMPDAVAYLERETKKIENTVQENRELPPDKVKLGELKTAVSHMKAQAEAMLPAYPYDAPMLQKAIDDLKGMESRIGSMQRTLFKKKFF